MNQSRRSFAATLASAALFSSAASQSLLAGDQETPTPELPKWQLSPAGKKFQIQMFGELIHFQLFSPPQVSAAWSETSRSVYRYYVMNRLNPWNHRKEIAGSLNLTTADMDKLREEPKRVLTSEEWRVWAAELTPEDATAIYVLGSKVHHVEALLALARGKQVDEIAKYKLNHAPPLKPGEKPYDIRGALGLYSEPSGKYGLGGSESDQVEARRILFMVRDRDGSLVEVKEAARQLRPEYAAPLMHEIVDNTRARAALHVPALERSKYGEAIQILQKQFPNEITVDQMRAAQAEVLNEKKKSNLRASASNDIVYSMLPDADPAKMPRPEREH